jgi:iron complex outermembrane receptor protein
VQLFAHGENLLGQRYETLYGYPMPRATLQSGVRFKF